MKCGIFESNITPPLGACIPGYFSVRRVSGIKDPVCSEAVCFEQDGQKAVLIVNDLESMYEGDATRVREEVARALNMSVDAVTVSCTHSHTSGPAAKLPGIHDDWEYDPAYADFVVKTTVAGAVEAARRMEEVFLSFAVGKEESISFCRVYRQPDGSLKTWGGATGTPYVNIDPDVSVLRIDRKDGTPYGMIVNFACHCDCVGGTEVSADYPGEMRNALRAFYGKDFHPVFVNGFCGNINHVSQNNFESEVKDHYKRMGRMLAADAIRTRELAVKPFEDRTVAAKTAKMTLPTRQPTDEEIGNAKKMLADPAADDKARHFANNILYAAGEKEWTVTVQAVKIGDVTIYALPGETCTEFGRIIKENAVSKHVLLAYHANGQTEYTAPRELFVPGVYEGRVGSGKLNADGGYCMTEKVLELARELEK